MMWDRPAILVALTVSTMAAANAPVVASYPISNSAVVISLLNFLTDSDNPRLIIDYSALQSDTEQLANGLDLPRDNCASFGTNAVLSIRHATIAAQNDGSALLSVVANFDNWMCVQNPIPNTRVEWQFNQAGPIKTKVPIVRTYPGSPIKTKMDSGEVSFGVKFNLLASGSSLTVEQAAQAELSPDALHTFPSGINGFQSKVIKVIADGFQKMLDPSDLLKKAQAALPPGIQYKGAAFLTNEGKLQGALQITP